MAVIFVDEAGHSGSNLLDSEQPVFVLASHDISEDECQQLRSKHFSHVKARSLKFSQLWRRPRSQRAVVEFIADVSVRFQGRIDPAVIHKPFALICKLVDHVIEPSMHLRGYNLYKGGGNIATANLIYLFLNSVAQPEYRTKVLTAIQRIFTRQPGIIPREFELLLLLNEKTSLLFDGTADGEALARVMSLPQLALMDLGPAYFARCSKDDLQVAFTTALLDMSRWGEIHRGMNVIHDESSIMLKQFDHWAKVTSASAPAATIAWDRRTMRYPIGVNSTQFQPDEGWAGLQIADVIAGSFAKALAGIAANSVEAVGAERDLVKLVSEWTLHDPIWPSTHVTPEEMGTQGPEFRDPFEFFEQHLL